LLVGDLAEELSHTALKAVLHFPGSLHVGNKFLNTSSGVFDTFHGGEGVEPVGDVCHERTFVGLCNVTDVVDVKQVRDADFLGSNVKGQLHVSTVVVLVEFVVVDEVGAMDIE
jgi:hypothetical protein